MLGSWKRSWNAVKKGPPGERFVKRYRARESGRSPGARVVSIALGAALVVAGTIMLVIPGPGILVIALGGAFLAQEFLWLAKALDFAEVRLRSAVRRGCRFWASSSGPVRIGVISAAGVCAAGGAYVAWQWFFA